MMKFYVVIYLCFVSSFVLAKDSDWQVKANDLLSQEQWQEAVDIHPKDNLDALQMYNLAVGYYHLKQYDSAVEHLQLALLKEAGNDLKQKIHYNLANAYFRLGQSVLQEEQDKTIDLWRKAVVQYGRVLDVDGNNVKAKENKEFVENLLKSLENQQQQSQQSQQQDQQQNQDQQNQDQQQSNQNQDQQNQDQSSQGNQSQQENDQQQSQQSQQQNQPDQQNEQEQQQSSGNDESDSDQEQPSGSQGNQEQEDQEDQKQPAPGENEKDESEDNKENESSSSSQNESDKQQDQSPSSAPQAGGSSQVGEGELTEKEALMLLENYQYNEQPKGMLNFIPRSSNTRGEPINDW